MIKVQVKGMGDLLKTIGYAILNDAENTVRNELNTNPNGLAQHFYLKVISDNEIEIGNDSPHAEYVEYGTLPHWIRPKNKQALSFPRTGSRGTTRNRGVFEYGGKKTTTKNIVVKYVFHPGTAPVRYFGRAIQKVIGG